MALKFHNTTNLEATVGSTAMHASSSVAMTTGGVTSAGVTAPNTSNAATGVILYFSSLPNTSAVMTVELMESGVSKKSATINGTDVKLGFNYVRFATTYTFATLTASAYTVKVTSTLNSGNLVQATSGLWFEITYDSTSSPANTDDIIMCGWHDGGLTAKQWDISGTSTVFGNGTIKNLGASIQRTMQCALMIGNGGTVKMDDTADCTVEIKGSVFITMGGLFDKRAHTSNIEIVSKLIMNCDVASNDYVISMPSSYGGRMLTDGMTVNHRAAYASGTGTAANPIVTSAAHGFKVNDELIIPGLTYNGNQSRFVISIPSSTQLVVSGTLGGAESAITNTPAVGSYIGQMTRNSIVTAKTTTRGYALFCNSSTEQSSFAYTRWEYASCSSGYGLNFCPATATVLPNLNGMVGYKNPASGRISWFITGTLAQTIDDCILYDTQGSNYVGQSGFTLQSASNKTINRFLHFAEPGSTTNCAGISLASSSTNNIFNDCHMYGATANNGSLSYAIGVLTSHGNTFNSCTVNNSRVRAIYGTDGFNNTFINCNFGTTGTNVVDIFIASSSLATMLFSNCEFGSATLLSNYNLSLTGSEFKFHKYQATAHKHRWYTPNGYAQATGTSLEDTTVRTAASYNVKINPENNTTGFVWEFTVKSIVDQISFLKAYLRKNSTMGTSVAKVEIFMPGTDTTGTADAIFTASNATDTWQDFVIGKLYSGTENTEALIRVTAISATAGAGIYLADFFDGVDALNSWFEAKPTKVVAPTDFTAVAGLLWSYPDTNTTAGTMGKRQVDGADNAEAAAYDMYK